MNIKKFRIIELSGDADPVEGMSEARFFLEDQAGNRIPLVGAGMSDEEWTAYMKSLITPAKKP